MKKIILLLIITIICMSGCTTQTDKFDETTDMTITLASIDNEQTTAETIFETDNELEESVAKIEYRSDNAPYGAYAQKYGELIEKYGKITLTDVACDYYEMGCSYFGGVCVVDLMDFNGDGIDDLFVIYSNGQLTGKNIDGLEIPQAGTYEIEIWTYKDNTTTQLLHESHVGYFYSFNTIYWDNDNCFATVYENDAGLPVIQLYSDNGNSCSYTNLYYSGETLIRDELFSAIIYNYSYSANFFNKFYKNSVKQHIKCSCRRIISPTTCMYFIKMFFISDKDKVVEKDFRHMKPT